MEVRKAKIPITGKRGQNNFKDRIAIDNEFALRPGAIKKTIVGANAKTIPLIINRANIPKETVVLAKADASSMDRSASFENTGINADFTAPPT